MNQSQPYAGEGRDRPCTWHSDFQAFLAKPKPAVDVQSKSLSTFFQINANLPIFDVHLHFGRHVFTKNCLENFSKWKNLKTEISIRICMHRRYRTQEEHQIQRITSQCRQQIFAGLWSECGASIRKASLYTGSLPNYDLSNSYQKLNSHSFVI